MGGHVERMGEMACIKSWLEDLKGRDHLKDLGIGGRISE
jgi:hypothetical protein